VLVDLFIALIRLHGFLRSYYVRIPVEELHGNTWYPNPEIQNYIDQIAADERELLGRVQWDDDPEYENYAPSPGIYPDDALAQWTEAHEQRFLTSFGHLDYFMGEDSIPPPLP
jgi:hypothetical protein